MTGRRIRISAGSVGAGGGLHDSTTAPAGGGGPPPAAARPARGGGGGGDLLQPPREGEARGAPRDGRDGRPRVLAARLRLLHFLRPHPGQPWTRDPAGERGERVRPGRR